MQNIARIHAAAMRKAASLGLDKQAAWYDYLNPGSLANAAATAGRRMEGWGERMGAKAYDAIGKAQDWAGDKLGQWWGEQAVRRNNARTQFNRNQRALHQAGNEAFDNGQGFLGRAARMYELMNNAGARLTQPGLGMGAASGLGDHILDTYDRWAHGKTMQAAPVGGVTAGYAASPVVDAARDFRHGPLMQRFANSMNR